jgi:septum formation protein
VNPPALVLASASPRRRDLLEGAGLTFSVRPAAIDETPRSGEAPLPYVRRMAREKALAVNAGPGEVVLAADTVVTLDGAVLGKPSDAAAACATLRTLSGRIHRVHTGVALRDGRHVHVRVTTTSVRFRVLSDADVARYVATGEPFDKAGGYGVQGYGGALVERLVGSYTNVVGLPLAETLTLLARAGVHPRPEETRGNP